VHLLFFFSLARICHSQCTNPITCSYSVTLPAQPNGHGAGWSFADQGEDDNRQVVWGFEVDSDDDFLIHWSNAYDFQFQAVIVGPDGTESTSWTMGAAAQTTTTGTQYIPNGYFWLGDTVKISLTYSRTSLRRLKDRSIPLITRDIRSRQSSPAVCNTCIVETNV
jgi:hypothetical protein